MLANITITALAVGTRLASATRVMIAHSLTGMWRSQPPLLARHQAPVRLQVRTMPEGPARRRENIDPALRSPDEQAAWQEVVSDSLRAARIRAAQPFIQLISTMDDQADNVCWSHKSASESAICARA